MRNLDDLAGVWTKYLLVSSHNLTEWTIGADQLLD